MQKIDVRGKLCPEPLIITRRAIKQADVNEAFEIILDNDIATCNLEELLREMKLPFTRVDNGAESTLLFSLNGDIPLAKNSENIACPIPLDANDGDYVVVISSEGMSSDDELGTILMRGFINSISEQDILPSKIILYNSGVKVCTEGKDTAITLKELTGKGVDIVICGVCVDYFEIRDKIAAGRISNMFEITKIKRTASRLLYP